MSDFRRVTSMLTGLAFLFQTLFLPLASGAQTSKNFLVRVCVPPDLVKNSWTYPYPGSEMDAFKNLLRDYVLAHGDRRVQYRIKDNAFEIFSRARRASAPYTSDPRNLLEEVSADQACPPTNYTNTLEVGPDNNSPHPPAQPPAVQDSVPPSAQGSVPPYPLTPKDAVQLGWQYQFGQGVPKDLPRALQLYTAAAQKGSMQGQYLLGLLYLKGDGVQKDPGVAAKWFYEAGRRGHAYAQEELGWMFASGEGTKRDDRAAFAWFLPAADAGLVNSQVAVAAMYDDGDVVQRNAIEAVKWYRKGAAQNQVFAMYKLGIHLRQRDGVGWSEAEAMQWFKKAADQGYAPAQYSLGYGYEHGLGQAAGQGVQDYHQAAFWLEKAARQGEAYAQIDLGLLYEDGRGVERDPQQARALYLSASRSTIPKVVEFARKFLANLPDSSGDRAARSSGKSTDWMAPVVFGLGILALASLFSGPSAHGGSGGPSDVGSYPTSTGVDWPTSTPEIRTPECHQVPMGFDTPNGLGLSNPTAGGGPTRLECN